MSLVKAKKSEDEDKQMIIKPEAVGSNVNTADWPLLLKNYDQSKSNFLHSCVRQQWQWQQQCDRVGKFWQNRTLGRLANW